MDEAQFKRLHAPTLMLQLKEGDDRIWAQLTEKQKKSLERRFRTAVLTTKAIQQNGAGQPADQLLRELLREYNNRLFQHGLQSELQPSNFDFGQSYIRSDNTLHIFRLLPERDYVIDASDWLEYVSSKEAPPDPLASAYDLADDEIYNISSAIDPHDVMMANGTNAVGFISVSLVRRRADVVATLQVAAKHDFIRLWTRTEDSKCEDSKSFSEGKVFLEEAAKDVLHHAHPLTIAKDLYRTVALTRFDLEKRQVTDRQLMVDYGTTWTGVTDSPAGVPYGLSGAAEQEWLSDRNERLEKGELLWRMSETCLLLPAYLSHRYRMAVTKQVKTELAKHGAVQRKAREADPDARIRLRKLTSLIINRKESAPSPVGRQYTPPSFQVSVTGFWRRLSTPESWGKDGDGKPVQGRTWVKAHLRYREKFNREEEHEQRVVFVKETLRSARARAHGLRHKPEDAPIPEPVSAKETPISHIYVLTSPALKADLWKIGYTDRDPEQRALEISTGTGVPVKYLVVQSWAVTDGPLAEAAAHAALEDYRVSTRREFFQGRYETIRVAILEAIRPWMMADC